MKKKGMCLVLAICFAAGLMPMRKAHALIGASMGNLPLMIIGAVVGVLGIEEMCASSQAGYFNNRTGARFTFGLLLGIGGLVVLDEKGSDVGFGPLSLDQGHKLGFSDDEIQTYNDDLPELEAAREEVLWNAQKTLDRGEKVKMKDLHDAWDKLDLSDRLDAKTLKVLKGVSAAIQKKLN